MPTVYLKCVGVARGCVVNNDAVTFCNVRRTDFFGKMLECLFEPPYMRPHLCYTIMQIKTMHMFSFY